MHSPDIRKSKFIAGAAIYFQQKLQDSNYAVWKSYATASTVLSSGLWLFHSRGLFIFAPMIGFDLFSGTNG